MYAPEAVEPAVTLYFTGPAREAAEVLLARTTLGERLTAEPYPDALSVVVYAPVAASLSSGERQLLKLLESLSGVGHVNLMSLAHLVDGECRKAASLAIITLLRAGAA